MDIVPEHMLIAVNNIDFGCEFNNGVCIGARDRVSRGLKDIGKICCRGCFHNVGYFRVERDQLPENYLAYFTYPDGFWSETGCKLPYEMRARRCVIYTCVDSKISDENRQILTDFEQEI